MKWSCGGVIINNTQVNIFIFQHFIRDTGPLNITFFPFEYKTKLCTVLIYSTVDAT